MNLYTLVILLLIGITAGFLAGFFGIGGGLIIVPALIFFAGFTTHQAVGTSLAVLLPPIGLLAVLSYYKEGHINFKYAAIIAIAFIASSYFSSKIAVNLSEDLIRKAFSILLIIIAIRMFFFK